MQKDKHNIYSKEELLKLIKEGKNAPADMDEFEREALEGLKLLDKPEVLNELDAEIDSIVAKDKRKKTIYYFSAAASLVLIIGFILFFKNEFTPNVTKNERPIASAENIKAPEESTTPSTTLPQPETQTTYEAKEPEAKAKTTLEGKKEELNSIAYQSSSVPVVAEEKMQEVKQGGKDADNQFDTKGGLSNKADNYEESKVVAATQTKQEQHKEVISTETETTSNNTISDGEKDNDKSKAKKAIATGNNAQPTQVAFSGADIASNTPTHDKKDENIAPQKNISAGFSYMASPDKKSNVKNYREPAFIGGDTAFATYAKQHLKISSPLNSGIIVVEFLITKEGKAEKIKVIKPITGCNACSQDIINLIKSVENWSPAAVDSSNSAAYKKISIQYN